MSESIVKYVRVWIFQRKSTNMGVINVKQYIIGKKNLKKNDTKDLRYDVIVVGGGMSGVCAAISSARNGARTAIIHDRSVFGGNASSEIRMHVCGASCHWGKKNALETGIILELQLDNKKINDNYCYSLWDSVLWSKVRYAKDLDMYLNTIMFEVKSTGESIEHIMCYQSTTETTYRMTAHTYIDCTGHGTLGYMAGAIYRIGSEDKYEFNESLAGEKPNGNTMGNTLLFCARKTDHPVKFEKPEWAYSFSEDDLEHRPHGEIIVYHDGDSVVTLPKNADYEHITELVEKYDVSSGYWWIELGGDWDDIIKQAEDIRDELYKCLYGIWDHIKNSGDHGAENYELVWVGAVPGIRESRRLAGDYLLNQNDIYTNREFEDAVAYGGWPMDEHVAGGLRAKGEIPSRVFSFDGLYSIPYRCYYSKNIVNLMMAGRNISATKLGLSSARVMGTCAVGGEAVGAAAAMAAKYKCSPREIGLKHIKELRQLLLKADCYIPGVINEDERDLAREANVTATSELKGCEAINVISGISRTVKDSSNVWESDGISANGEELVLSLDKQYGLKQIRLTFDPNLSEEKCISVSQAFKEKQRVGVPCELVKDFEIEFRAQGKPVYNRRIEGNYQRHVIVDIPEAIAADKVLIRIFATNGYRNARVFEVRIY
jgi:hypothetical protein